MSSLEIWACYILLRNLVQVGLASWLNLVQFYELQMTLVYDIIGEIYNTGYRQQLSFLEG